MCNEDWKRRSRNEVVPSGDGPVIAHAHYDEKNGLIIIPIDKEELRISIHETTKTTKKPQ